MATVTKAGRYEIVGELGRGAMGVVYRAVDPVIGRTVAVKTIHLSEEGTGMSRPELLQRFQTEARAAGLLAHPNIVVVFDAGEEEGLYYITMELVEGKSLQAMLDGGQTFPLSRVLRIMEQTCSALQFAHDRNIVHRDIKPANLMMTGDDTVKITDFGTAKILQFGTVQQTAHVMGTPSYMSPEQVKGKMVDGRSDIFSLGVVLYEMMTGEKPFPGQNITTVIYKIVNEEPVPPRSVDPTIHPGISAAVMKALAKDPDQRYQSCRELFEDLRNYRTLAGNAESTVALAPAAGAGGVSRSEEALTTAQALRTPAALGGGSPSQTPVLRRTGTIPPLAEPKKSSAVATVLAAMFLLAVIAYGGYRIRPFMQDMMERRRAQRADAKPVSAPVPAAPSAPLPSSSSESEKDPAPHDPAPDGNPAVPPAGESKLAKEVENKPASPVSKKTPPVLSSTAAEFKGRTEKAITEKGLSGRVKMDGIGNALTLTGKLRPPEHRELLKVLRSAPAGVRVVDDIEYEDTPESAAGNGESGEHPVPGGGRGGIHIVTDVIGATAVLRGPAGREIRRCETPCSFNNLFPAGYSLDVSKGGYRPVQTALQIRAGDVIDQKIQLESLLIGLYVRSRPAGADVFIDGAKQPGQTPLTLSLGVGQYNIVIKLEGYEPFAGQVQVKNNIQTLLNVDLTARVVRSAWADVRSQPAGADILIDGVLTGQTTPARVKTTAGTHRVVLSLKGYRPVTRIFAVDEGQTVQVHEGLTIR
ncbi:MAG TPA: serine/threonine-protein kinase [Candidatus Acidoferrales bacterium]|nr:serine/threonine-protein kinase [Candidatus Acidoferrales bacterium]